MREQIVLFVHFFRDYDECYKLVVNSLAMPIIDQKDNYLASGDVQGVSKKRRRLRRRPTMMLGVTVLGACGLVGGGLYERHLLIDEQSTVTASNERLAAQLASVKQKNKELSEQVLKLSEVALEWQGKYARDVRSLRSSLRESEASSTIIFPSSDDLQAPTDLSLQNSGDWFINFETYYDQAAASSRLRDLRDALSAVDVKLVPGIAPDGREVFRLRAAGFSDRSSTNKTAIWITSRLDVNDLWIGQSSVEDARVQEQKRRSSPQRLLRYVVMVAEYIEVDQARAVAEALSNNGLRAESAPYTNGTKTTHRVYIPDLPDKETAEAILRGLSKTGSFNGAKILRSFNIVD